MRIAEYARPLTLGIVALLVTSVVVAHPVAQGQLQVEWQEHALRIDARVSGEQILIASTLLPETAVDSLSDLQREHARYLLQHLQVQADGAHLDGRLLEVRPDGGDFVLYRLSYQLAQPPQQLQLRQDLLNEIAYTPGNLWEASFVVRNRDPRGEWRESLLTSKNRALVLDVGAPPTTALLAMQFFAQGIRHMLSGYDHLLFVSALVLAAVTLRKLIAVIAAFTLAHSITLALSALHWMQLPPSIVEPMIAGSIVTVALANVIWPNSSDGWPRLMMAFCFGLFHGLGFAGGLLEANQ